MLTAGARCRRMVKNSMVENAGGKISLGKPKDFPTFGWDNEYGSRTVDVVPFKATKFLITNAEYLQFVSSGGCAPPHLTPHTRRPEP